MDRLQSAQCIADACEYIFDAELMRAMEIAVAVLRGGDRWPDAPAVQPVPEPAAAVIAEMRHFDPFNAANYKLITHWADRLERAQWPAQDVARDAAVCDGIMMSAAWLARSHNEESIAADLLREFNVDTSRRDHLAEIDVEGLEIIDAAMAASKGEQP